MITLETILQGIFVFIILASPFILGFCMAEWQLRYIFGPRSKSKPHTPLQWGKTEISASNHHKDESN